MSADPAALPLADLIPLLRTAEREAAWRELLAREGRDLYAVCYRICGTVDLAEDALQEACLQVLAAAGSFAAPATGDPERAARAWLRRIAGNVALNLVRAETRRHRRERSCAMERPANPAAPPPADDDRLRRALGELPPAHRQPTLLTYFADLSHEEAAAELGCSVPAARKRLSRSLKKLKRIMTRLGAVTGLAALATRLEALAAAGAPAVPATCLATCEGLAAQLPPPVTTPYPAPTQGVPMSLPLAAAGAAAVLATAGWWTFRAPEPPPPPAVPAVAQPLPVVPAPADPPHDDGTMIVDLHLPMLAAKGRGEGVAGDRRLRFTGRKLDGFAEQLAAEIGGRVEVPGPAWPGQVLVIAGAQDSQAVIAKLGRTWNIRPVAGKRHEYTVTKR